MPWVLTKMVPLVSSLLWLYLESAIKIKGSQADTYKLSHWILIHSNNGSSSQRWSEVWREMENILASDTNPLRDKPASSLILYALPAAKEVLHFSLFSQPSKCSSLLSFLTVTLSHLLEGELILLYRLRILCF